MADSVCDKPLFKDVRYYAIGVLDGKIEKLLADGKAKQEAYLSGLATHAIVTEFANLEVEEARDVWQIPAVTVKWVELSHKCKKLLPTEAFTPSNSELFTGLVFCPSQLNKQDINLLWALSTFYGGSCQVTLNKSCTHLVTPAPKGAKYEEASKHSETICIVTIDWVLDSVKSKLLQDTKLYHPTNAILPEERPEPANMVVPDTQSSEQDAIASSLQNMAVLSAAEQASQKSTQMTVVSAAPAEMKATTTMHSSQSVPLNVSAHGVAVSIAGSAGQGAVLPPHTQPGQPQPVVTMMQPEREVHPFGQTIISQTGQQYILTSQPQMMAVQQFQLQQRQPTPGSTSRLPGPATQQRFPSPPKPASSQRQSTPTTKKTPQRRRRSSTKSKANAAASTATVPSSPIHTNQIVNISQQQLLQQQNQHMLMNQHRIMMQHQQQQQAGLGNKVGFMQQQQLYQNQHFAGMQGKAQVPPTSPQKQPQHIMTEQAQGAMRPFIQGNYSSAPMRMQQPQQRAMQVPTQMMTMGLGPQVQFQQQQQQVKMAGLAQQQQAPSQFSQQPQQGVIIQRAMPMQVQAQGLNQGKLQAQRMQVSPQQQNMYMQRHMTKEGVPPRQALQQQSPMKQQSQAVAQQQAQLQMPVSMTQQQQQQLMMQQMAQRQLQMQLSQSQSQLSTQQQKQTPPPTSHAPINVGIGVISPTALQQGLMMAQAQQNQGFQAPLVHPSLQTPQDYGKVTPQSSSTKSRRSKSRKPKDGDENAESKPKSKSRSRSKKSSQSPASAAPSPGGKKLSQNSPSITGIASTGYYQQTPLNVMTPPPHGTVPVAFAANKQTFVTPTATVSPLAATENTFGPSHIVQNAARMDQPPQSSPKVETRYLPQHTPTPTPPLPHRGPFNNPLEMVPKSYEGKFYGHDPAENVPQDLCLLGCVFVITEYQGTVPDIKIIEHWKKVINKFGGIVEEEYNTCTCTHILCISQTTSLFKDALLEGKRCVTVYWLNDVLHIRKLQPPWLAIHIPTPFSPGQKPAAHHTISYTGFYQKERERLRMMANVCGCKFSGFLSRSNTVLVCKGTLSLKYDKAREWRIPCVSVHWLKDILHGDTEALSEPGQLKYQNFDEKCQDLFSLDETKAQKILDPWKVPVRVTLDCMQRARVKRKNSVPDASAVPMKRARIEGSYQPLPRVCFTGLPTKEAAELQKTLESLQGQTSKNISLSTHLVAKCISRTVKFLCAISVCQYIVTPEWIEDSGKSNWLLDEDKYLLYDKSAEEKFNFSLKESLKRARTSPLFQGYVFCITESVAPDRKILTEIVECAGGKVIQKIPSIPDLKRLQNRKVPNNQLLLVSCPADEEQVMKWKQEGIQVHNAEIILTGVLKQEVNLTAHQL